MRAEASSGSYLSDSSRGEETSESVGPDGSLLVPEKSDVARACPGVSPTGARSWLRRRGNILTLSSEDIYSETAQFDVTVSEHALSDLDCW